MYLQKYPSTVFILFALLSTSVQCQSKLYRVTDCTCLNYSVKFRCHIQARGQPSTLWTGTAFEDGCAIILRPDRFETVHHCNPQNSITGEGVRILSIDTELDTHEYISELSVCMTSTLNGTSVECKILRGTNETSVGSSILILSEDYPPPRNFSLIGVDSNRLNFTWNMAETCPAIRYGVRETNCGNCIINDVLQSNLVICTDFATGSTCTLSVHSIVCNQFNGSMNTSLRVATTLPSPPQYYSIPTYTAGASTAVLKSINTSITIMPNSEDSFAGIRIPVTSYTINYYTTSDNLCGSRSIDANTCVLTHCSVIFNLHNLEHCRPFTGIKVAVSATNKFGTGSFSSLSEIDGRNKFVSVAFKSTTQKATCTFLNQESSNGKTCSLRLSYGQNCSKHLLPETKSTTGNTIDFNLDIVKPTNEFCYILTATNGTLTVIQIGTFNLEDVKIIIFSTTSSILVCIILCLCLNGISYIIIKLYKKKKLQLPCMRSI